MTTLPPTEMNCPGTATTEILCNKIPNATWIASDVAGSGVCHCCKQDGTAYIDSTNKSIPCKACVANTAHCGDNNGFCNGSTGNTKIPCKQNSNTKKWSTDCTAGCGAQEWYAFSKCTPNASTGSSQCGFNISQWKSWLVYGMIFFLILLFIVIIVILTRPRNPKTMYIPSTTNIYPSSIQQGMARIQ